MEDLKKYLKDTLGVTININLLTPEKLRTLPIFIGDEYDLGLTRLYHRELLLVFVKNEFTTEKLKKHLDIIKSTINLNAVAIINQIEAYNRLRLIEKKISFIVPGKQMYMPDLFIDLKEYGNKPKEQPHVMQPAAQLLLLYHLQIESLEGINLKGIAEKLYYNAMTITRAAYYLYNVGLCAFQGTKDKFLHFDLNKKDLWKKAEPLMNNPIKKSIFYSGWISDENIYKSNINALAHYSDINEDVVEYFAVKPGYSKHIGGINLKIASPFEGNICIEEWSYNPYLLSKQTKIIDPLSLFLCFRESEDERIKMALEQVIEKVW